MLALVTMRLVLVPNSVDALAALVTVAASTTVLAVAPTVAIRIASGEEVVASISGQVRAIAWIGGVVPGILLGTTAAAASVQWPAIAIPVIGANFALGLTILIRAAVHPDRFLATWRRHARLQNITPTPPAGRAER